MAQDAGTLNAQFRQWLASDLWPEAARRGVSQADFNAAFSGVSLNLKLPDLVIPGQKKKVPREQHQAEFRAPSAYFREAVIGGVVSGGRPLFQRHSATLKAIERETGVPGRITVAIWGRESGFGRAKLPYNAFEVLGTKAFMSTRKDYFRGELIAALEMVSRRHVNPRALMGSWAGALGQPQFMPSSYLAHARDGDGDRVADIWRSEADTLASIAGYLADKGWVRGRDWGFEVTVPDSVSCAMEGPDRGMPISRWEAMGIRRVNGKPFPAHERAGEGYLMMPAGRHGPAFIVTPNFYVLKEYNTSDLYALFVGHAGDRMQYNSPAFSASWNDTGEMFRSEIAAMQRGLERLGYDVGGADGLPGFKTRRSIGDWQARSGLKATCFPTRQLAKRF
jgi:lytic murein transglycosylase